LGGASDKVATISQHRIARKKMMLPEKKSCKSCPKKTHTPTRNYGVWGGLLLALLPKCPFCVMAYSGTLMLCSKDSIAVTEYTNISATTIVFTSFFCLLALVGIFFNKRGIRTNYALLLAIVGSCLVMTGVLYDGGWTLYYGGVALLFAAVWLNGSLWYFINKAKAFFHTHFFHSSQKQSA
jgi:hypothetical protein